MIELLHNKEQIQHWDKQNQLASELHNLFNKYKNSELEVLSQEINLRVQEELDKYNIFVGREALAPPSFLSKDKELRPGKIGKITHFNAYSSSVRCEFRYKNGGGFDGHALKDLTLV